MSDNRQYFEDFRPGDVVELGSVIVDEHQMQAFNTEWDPALHARPDRELPADAPVASGWFVGAATMRLLVDGLLNGSAAQGSSGLDQLKFVNDVQAGDELFGRYIVLDAAESAGRPEIGRLRVRIEAVNQRGEPVLTMEATQFFRRRDA